MEDEMTYASCRGGWSRHAQNPPEQVSRGDDMDHQGMLFGVRRPLRFMAHRLELDEDQIRTMAQILATLKTERAQAAVDDQRTVTAFADALEARDFEPTKVEQGLEMRMRSAERLRDAVRKALADTHAMLRSDQRVRLAYLLRSGALTI
ncbi:MAG: hypothetical protein HC923_09040 [Myxococcales bacterium]|nr:hypothetical protein [Myxococcales bacterium]